MGDPVSAEVSRPIDRDYVLGTHDREIERLGIQHEAWRDVVIACWRRAGVSAGDHVLDVGAGPGHAAFDLSRIVGTTGSVSAIERSARFVSAGRAAAAIRGLANIDYFELDLMVDPLPAGHYDAAWCRWVSSFVESPEVLVRKIAGSVRPGGTAIFHEYADYASWRFSPRLPVVEEYIRRVMESWRGAGGEPDVAMRIPPLLRQHGFTIREAVPRVFCVGPGDAFWTWISTFVDLNLDRLVELGTCDPLWIEAARDEFRCAEADPDTLMLTPMVLEIVADRIV